MSRSLLLGIGLIATVIAIIKLTTVGPIKEVPYGLRPSGAMEALTFWTRQRAYPSDELPPAGYARAAAQARDLQRLHRHDESSEAPWEAIGPHNVAGRILDIAVNPANPRTLWAGSASGGLWWSWTGGEGAEAWHRVSTGFPVLAISTIAFAPEDTLVMYVGTGEVYNYVETHKGVAIRETRGAHGIGILKTTDGGQTWQHALDWRYDANRGVQRLRVNPKNPRTVWAATTEGLLVSYDAGATWQQKLDVVMGTDLIIHAKDTLKMVAAMGNLGSMDAGIYASMDGGQTWVPRPEVVPFAWRGTYGGKAVLAAQRANPDLVYASIGNGSLNGAGTVLSRSKDGGMTWEIVNTGDYATYQGWYSHFVVPHPVDTLKLLTAGIDVFGSDDGGVTLARRSNWAAWGAGTRQIGGPEGPPDYIHADHHAFALHPTANDTVYFANDGGIARTTDFGKTFRALNGGLQTAQFYNGTSNSQQDSLFALGGLQDNSYVFYHGSKAWRLVPAGDGTWTAIHPQNDEVVYASSQYLNLNWSNNRGVNWATIRPHRFFSVNAAFVAPFVLAPSEPNIMYAGERTVLRSPDGGTVWARTNQARPLDGNYVISMAVSPSLSNTVLVGTAPTETRAGIWLTTNGGDTWQNVTGNLPDRYPMDIAIQAGPFATAYVVFSGFGIPHVWKTTDGGASWRAVSEGLPDVPTNAVVIDPLQPETVFIGNDLGVYVSRNGGESWAPFRTGLPEAVLAMDLTISPRNRKLRLATYGNGMYERQLPRLPDVPLPPVTFDYAFKPSTPNPARTEAFIEFSIATDTRVLMRAYDLSGRLVATLLHRDMQRGPHLERVNVSDWAAGVYVVVLRTPDFQATQRIVVVK